eukprot:1160622-Pelagomonas_calceolata.AAC.12
MVINARSVAQHTSHTRKCRACGVQTRFDVVCGAALIRRRSMLARFLLWLDAQVAIGCLHWAPRCIWKIEDTWAKRLRRSAEQSLIFNMRGHSGSAACPLGMQRGRLAQANRLTPSC